MAAVFIRVQTLGAVYIALTPPAVKLKDQATGEIATDRATGENLYTVQLAETVDGRAQVIKVTLAESKLPKGLVLGAVVHPENLVASPWARIFNGQLSDGVTYRADGLAPAAAVPAK
jgi:hypothetical protein